MTTRQGQASRSSSKGRHAIGDIDQTVPGESLQFLTTENTILKHRVQQLTREHRKLQERLEGARSNLCFAEKRTADLEVQVLELQQGQGDVARSALAGPTLTPQRCLDVE